jgi:hypothetical protein
MSLTKSVRSLHYSSSMRLEKWQDAIGIRQLDLGILEGNMTGDEAPLATIYKYRLEEIPLKSFD